LETATATATITVDSRRLVPILVSLSGVATIPDVEATLGEEHIGEADVECSAIVSIAPSLQINVTVASSASATVSIDANVARVGLAFASCTATVVSDEQLLRQGEASPSATASLTVDEQIVRRGQADLSCDATLDVTGYIGKTGDIDVSADAEIAVSASAIYSPTISLQGVATIPDVEAEVSGELIGQAFFTGNATVAATVLIQRSATVDVAATASVSADGRRLVSTQVSPSASASISVSARRLVQILVSLTGVATIPDVDATIGGILTGQASSAGNATVTATVTILRTATITATAEAAIVVDAVRAVIGVAPVDADASVSIDGVRLVPIDVSLTGVATIPDFEAVVSGALIGQAGVEGNAAVSVAVRVLRRATVSVECEAVSSVIARIAVSGGSSVLGEAATVIDAQIGILGVSYLSCDAALSVSGIRFVLISETLTGQATISPIELTTFIEAVVNMSSEATFVAAAEVEVYVSPLLVIGDTGYAKYLTQTGLLQKTNTDVYGTTVVTDVYTCSCFIYRLNDVKEEDPAARIHTFNDKVLFPQSEIIEVNDRLVYVYDKDGNLVLERGEITRTLLYNHPRTGIAFVEGTLEVI
jgi:hypothetical protein